MKKLESSLKGSNEMPAADPDGSGTAKLRLDVAKKKVCFTITVKKIDGVVAAHIHAGGKSGRVRVHRGRSDQGARARHEVHGLHEERQEVADPQDPQAPAQLLRERPHEAFPGGAIRGQLHKP